MDESWAIDERDYPSEAGATEQLRFLVRYAVLAPSSHNTQPWRFVLERARLTLFADRRRRLPVVDPEDRELVISCGAALGQLEIAARHFGREPLVELLPEPDQPDLLARVALGGERAQSPDDTRLFSSILQRRTTRESYEPTPVPSAVRDDFASIAGAAGIELHAITERRARENIAMLVAEGDRRQLADPAFRDELAAWIRSRRSARHDGVSAEGFDMPDSLSGLGALALRTFDLGRGIAARDREIAAGSPLLLLLASETDDPRDWLRTGRALAALLLRAAASDVTVSYLNQPIEVEALRGALADLVRVRGHPQLLLRLGYSVRGRPSVRRPLEEVLEQPSLRPAADVARA